MKFIFTDDCMTGISQIDAEHRYLFDLMNKIVDTIKNGDYEEKEMGSLEEYIALLKDYGTRHFAHEEEYMNEHDDMELPRQKREHAMFMERMNSLDIQDLTNSEKRVMLEDTLRYLMRWLYYHIIGTDIMIGKVVDIAAEFRKDIDFCLFTDEYRTGIASIDAEHEKLFDIIRRAFVLAEERQSEENHDRLMEVLDELEDYTATHFAHEEEYMESINYPGLDVQRRAHSVFIEKMQDRDLGEELEDYHDFLEEMLDFLFGWLGNHILKMDKLIGEYTEQMGTIN